MEFSGTQIGNSALGAPAHPAPATTAKAIRQNGDMEGKGSGPHAWKASQLPNAFGFTDSAQLPPGLRTCTLGSEEGRKPLPRRRGTLCSDTLQPRPSAGSTRQRAIGYDRIAKQSTLS